MSGSSSVPEFRLLKLLREEMKLCTPQEMLFPGLDKYDPLKQVVVAEQMPEDLQRMFAVRLRAHRPPKRDSAFSDMDVFESNLIGNVIAEIFSLEVNHRFPVLRNGGVVAVCKGGILAHTSSISSPQR